MLAKISLDVLRQELCVNKLSLWAVCKKYGLSRRALQARCRKHGLSSSHSPPRKKDLTGLRVGALVVVSPAAKESRRCKRSSWLCKCDCGQSTVVLTKKLTTNGIKTCGCRHGVLLELCSAGQLDPALWRRILASTLRRSRNLPIDITPAYAWELFCKQNGRCALSGVELVFGKGSARTASLDRIDSSKGYMKGNIQWVHKDVNRMKQNFVESYFVETCRRIVTTADAKQQVTKVA